MKTLTKTFLLLVLFVAINFAQTFDVPKITRGESELVIDFGMASTALDSAAQDTSGIFSLEDYDGSSDDIFTLYSDLASGGTPKFSVIVQGCESAAGGVWTTLDTPLANSAVTTPVYTAFDIADLRAKYYRIIASQIATGAALTGYHIKIRACVKDNAVKN